jgi:hypothetical protein
MQWNTYFTVIQNNGSNLVITYDLTAKKKEPVVIVIHWEWKGRTETAPDWAKMTALQVLAYNYT